MRRHNATEPIAKFRRGQVMAAAGSLTSHRRFRAAVYVVVPATPPATNPRLAGLQRL